MTNKPNHNYILQAYDLVKKYDNRYVVDHVNFSVKPGEILGLLGPNGAGKTTFFYMTIGLIRPDQGKIFFKGEDITHLPIHFRAQKGMGYLAQEPSVFINMTVEENILCVIELQNLSRQERKDKLEQLLDLVSLEARSSWRDVITNLKNIDAAKIGLELQKEILENEQERFNIGLSKTNGQK